MIENIRSLCVGIAIAVIAFLKPIEGELTSLMIVFFLNFFFGYLSGMIANHEDFSIKKALRCGAEATVFFILCCAIYTVGQMKHQYEGALQCVSFVTYVVLYFYALNILKNLKKKLRKNTIISDVSSPSIGLRKAITAMAMPTHSERIFSIIVGFYCCYI
jgi:hypothetical protein